MKISAKTAFRWLSAPSSNLPQVPFGYPILARQLRGLRSRLGMTTSLVPIAHLFSIPTASPHRMSNVPDRLLRSTPTIDADHPTVRVFARENAGAEGDARHQAVALYYAVRDGIRYDRTRQERSQPSSLAE